MKDRNQEHSDDWKTPKWLYAKLDREFHFDFDPCPYKHDKELFNGLKVKWKNRNFINPPYSQKLKEAFIKKAVLEASTGKLCVMLLPVSTSTRIFHNWILPYKTEIRFLKGRVKFEGINTKGEYVTDQSGMHDSMIVIFDGNL